MGPQHPSPVELVDHLRLEYGFHATDELPAAMESTGEPAAAETSSRLKTARDQVWARAASGIPGSLEELDAQAVLIAVPDSAFASAVMHGLDVHASYAADYGSGSFEPSARLRHDIDRVLARNGIPYGFDGDGRLAPTGSRTMAEATIVPAYDALEDARLSAARTHVIEAVQRLREADEAEAVDEARMAVEAGMLALLDAHSVARPAKHQPQDLFNALVDAGILTRDCEELILAAPRFRGRTQAGHAGKPPVIMSEAEAAVGAGASALVFIAGKLP